MLHLLSASNGCFSMIFHLTMFSSELLTFHTYKRDKQVKSEKHSALRVSAVRLIVFVVWSFDFSTSKVWWTDKSRRASSCLGGLRLNVLCVFDQDWNIGSGLLIYYIFSVFAPSTFCTAQLQITCNYIVNHYVKMYYVHLRSANKKRPLSWGHKRKGCQFWFYD